MESINPFDYGYPVDPKRQCEAKVKGTRHRCKKLPIVDRHFCAYHSVMTGSIASAKFLNPGDTATVSVEGLGTAIQGQALMVGELCE